MFLEECKNIVKEKKIPKYITDDERFSSDETSNEKNSDKDNSDEENYSEE